MNRVTAKKLLEQLDECVDVSDYVKVLLNRHSGVDIRRAYNFFKNYQGGLIKAYADGGRVFDIDTGREMSNPEFYAESDYYSIYPPKKLDWQKVMKHGGYGLEFVFECPLSTTWHVRKLIGFNTLNSNAPFLSSKGNSISWASDCRLIEGVEYPDEHWYK